MNTTMENVKELNLDSEKEAACKKKKKQDNFRQFY